MTFVDDRWQDEPGILERSVEAAGRLLMSGMFISAVGTLSRRRSSARREPPRSGSRSRRLATRANGAAMVAGGVALATGSA
jgi:hypothetical protein